MATRIARHAELAAAARARADERSWLVRSLRAEGLPSMDRSTGGLLAAMKRAGVFRLGGTIVGTVAFGLYEAELGLRFADGDLARTGDSDIVQFERLSLALGDRVEEDLRDTFKALAFEPVTGLQGHSIWRWKQSRSAALVEFLTPSFRAAEDVRELPALGVAAQSLHFLNFLIAAPIRAAILYRSGVLVQIPRPEAYAIHKLIVADRRGAGPDRLKSRKDRAQAAAHPRACRGPSGRPACSPCRRAVARSAMARPRRAQPRRHARDRRDPRAAVTRRTARPIAPSRRSIFAPPASATAAQQKHRKTARQQHQRSWSRDHGDVVEGRRSADLVGDQQAVIAGPAELLRNEEEALGT
jgi:hypothetical protein